MTVGLLFMQVIEMFTDAENVMDSLQGISCNLAVCAHIPRMKFKIQLQVNQP